MIKPSTIDLDYWNVHLVNLAVSTPTYYILFK